MEPDAAGDPKEIVRRALRNDVHNRELGRSYTHVERDEERTLDSAGKVKRESLSASARLLLLKGIHQDGETVYTNYKKFSTDSRVPDTIQ